jgi:hypothetical protein
VSLTSRRRRPLDRSIPHTRDASLVVIATEGTSTEPDYFAMFRRKSTRVQVRVLETTGGRSAPRDVLARLKRYRREFQLGVGDSLCLVVDKDRWPDGQLAEVAAQATRLAFVMAVSRPCFELWLYLHRADPPEAMSSMSSREVEEALRALLGGYNKACLDASRFEPFVDVAVGRATVLDVRPDDRWPNQLGTRVYRVVNAIHERM